VKILGYSPWGNAHSIAPFNQLFDQSKDCFKYGMEGIDAFILWGGTDIHPSLYNEEPNTYSGAPREPSERDLFEWTALKYCKANNIPTIGICRGAQMQCAFAGGKLFQHVTGHTSGNHPMETTDGQILSTTSAHHQMLDLRNTNHELLAWSKNNLSKVYYGRDSASEAFTHSAAFREPEVVYFPDIKGLAIQGHPEWAHEEGPFVKYCLDKVQEYLFDEVWV
jgi:gamma-glutamyl-gamma-aminobutyrate hydrolase PuuD